MTKGKLLRNSIELASQMKNIEMKVVYFKVKGHLNTKYGPVWPTHTEETLKPVLAKAFDCPVEDITILELS